MLSAVRLRASSVVAGLVCVVLAAGIHAAAQTLPADGIASYQAGRYAEALQAFIRATENEPEDAVAWTWLGAAYLQLNRLPEAEQALRRAIDLDPQNPAAHLFLGITFVRMGKATQAREAFTRAKALAPGTDYDVSASAWLAAIPTVAGTPPPPGAAAVQCPTPPASAQVRRPVIPVSPGTAVEIASWGFSIEGADVHIDGEVSNQSDRPVTGIQVQATGYGIDGRELASSGSILEEVAAGDFRDFLVRLSTTPPPMWVRLRVLEYRGRRPEETRHSVFVVVPGEVYEPLVASRVKARVSAIPAGAARSQLLCAWIADSAGFPISSVRARVTVDGYSPARAERQVTSLDIVPGKATGITVQWRDPMRAVPQVELESVQLAPVP